MVTRTSATFAELLRRYRQAAGLTQQELAERAGLSAHGIQKLERGATHPYRDTARRLIEALRLDAEEQARLRATVVPMHRHGLVREADITNLQMRSNLPAPVTRLIGRDEAVLEVMRKLDQTRLLTLTGVGGCGKTRLALEVARMLTGSYADGVWLVELAPVTEPRAVGPRVAAVLGIGESAEQPLTAMLASALRHRQMLLLLDNCEHVLDASARLIDALLRGCAGLRVLTTSREPIGIGGEMTWRVPSLTLPDAASTVTLEHLSSNPAVELFTERAKAVRPGFALTTANPAAVVQICRRLDGIPLALELAAARIESLAPEEVARRLDQRFRLLTGGSRAALPRQQTLKATLDWSYDLLGMPERLLFERLAVFSGGWTLEAAEAICPGDDVDSEDVLDLLAKLTHKSLVLAEEAGDGAMRYALLESVRDYARQKLVLRGMTEMTALRSRHAAFYVAWVEQLMPVMLTETWLGRSVGLRDALLQIDAESDNIRLVLNWCLESNQPGPGIRIGIRLPYFWDARGLDAESYRWMQALLERVEATPGAHAIPRVDRAVALVVLAVCAMRQGEYQESRRRHDEAIALWRELGEDLPLAVALSGRGLVAWVLGELDDAKVHLDESRQLFEQCDRTNPLCVEYAPNALRNLGVVARSEGDYDRAAEYFLESVRYARVVSESGGSVVVRGLSHLARTRFMQGDIAQARQLFREALGMVQAHRIAGHGLPDCLDWLAAMLAAEGRPRAAAVLFGAADAQSQVSNALRYTPERARYADEVASVEADLTPEEFAAAWAEGRAMSREQVVDFALEQTWVC
jgi:predicted ATPase/DNA-binding XRE family transcriptional regulator